MNPFSPGRTITERDVKHLERHLSMKKTIRKKMMRDLQQAFVDDPTKFTDTNENKQACLVSLIYSCASKFRISHGAFKSKSTKYCLRSEW